MSQATLYLGLMSGTSIDSIDAAAVSFDQGQLKLLGTYTHPISDALRLNILNLSQPGLDSVQLYGETDHLLGHLFADAALALMASLSIGPDDIVAIGSHGQTIRHSPPKTNSIAFSQQIGDANIIAARTGCSVVSDFRRKDVALGGHGAPLVPAFHYSLFSHPQRQRVIANIGGIANITVLPADGACYGFDTGPGNLLLDAWCKRHTGKRYDDKGAWGATGQVDAALLKQLKTHPFLGLEAPKSTGREEFNLAWLESILTDHSLPPENVQATLTAFTAQTLGDAISALDDNIDEVYVCGGGAFNNQLMARLEESLPGSVVSTTDDLGLAPSWVEACAFAWLARQRVLSLPGNLPRVTGASRPAILGALYLP